MSTIIDSCITFYNAFSRCIFPAINSIKLYSEFKPTSCIKKNREKVTNLNPSYNSSVRLTTNDKKVKDLISNFKNKYTAELHLLNFPDCCASVIGTSLSPEKPIYLLDIGLAVIAPNLANIILKHEFSHYIKADSVMTTTATWATQVALAVIFPIDLLTAVSAQIAMTVAQ